MLHSRVEPLMSVRELLHYVLGLWMKLWIA